MKRLGGIVTVFLLLAATSAYAGTVYWSGPGGDAWNTNSSPYAVDPARPCTVLWYAYSSDGQYNRASGVALAEPGSEGIQYIFGSTGWGGNRPYRTNAADGLATGWLAESGTNDSGTGFRIALAPDGSRLYHIDVANVIRAYSTATDPGGVSLWAADGDAFSPGLANLIKVGPDGRIYGHYNGTAALDPATGERVWHSEANPENAFMPGAFFDTGDRIQYVVSGRSNVIAAYDIASTSPSSPIWTYADTEPGWPGPTIDPATGAIYVFRTTRVIKLTRDGELVWEGSPVDGGESGRSYGALSRDGTTFYYQTGSNEDAGKLYAFDTTDGSIRWRYPTGSRAREWNGGPVVSANGILFVVNGAVSPDDNMLFAIQDTEAGPVLLDTFDLWDAADSGGPSLAIGPDGVVYMDGWDATDSALLYAFQSQPLLPAPERVTATPYYSTVHLSWAPVTGGDFGGYLVYRRAEGEAYPETPTKYVGPRTQFTDYGLTPGTTYYYAVGTYDLGGRLNSALTEVSATLDDDPTRYSKHANLELLMAVYTEGWTQEEVDRYTNGLQTGLEFYWRNTGGRLNLDVTWLYIDAPIPATDGSYGPIEGDLRNRGIRNDQYDLLYTIGKGLAPCLGGYTVFGSTKASLGIVCGVAYPGKDPEVDYTVAWTFTHEIHHAIDGLVDLAGADDMLFCHFPWNYPDPLDGSWHVDWGTHYDGISATMRLYDDYFGFGSFYDGYIECVDRDGDAMPDEDSRVLMDEARFGSSPLSKDTDGDGLTDLGEYTRYNFTGTDPTRPDSDGDGFLDGLDHNPLYLAPDVIHAASSPPDIDGAIESTWPVLAEGYYFTQNSADFDLTAFATYDEEFLYLAFESTRQLRFMISLDGSGLDGRFESDVRHPDGTTDTYDDDTKGQQYGDTWGDGNHLYAYYGATEVQVYQVGAVPGARVASRTDGRYYRTEIAIPKTLPHGCGYTWYPPDAPVVEGLRLTPGQVIGLNVTFSNLSGSSAAEFSGTWTSLFETHAYVDFTLDSVCDDAIGAETCDGADNDCDGYVDEPDDVDYYTQYPDHDGDGYGAGDPLTDCVLHAGYALSAGDCDDTDPTISPGAEEVPDDGIDNDCDGEVDESGEGEGCTPNGEGGGTLPSAALFLVFLLGRAPRTTRRKRREQRAGLR